MNRYLMGIFLVLAATAAAADCKQDCKEAYKTCTQGATSVDDTMQCKREYKECAVACDAAGIAAAGGAAIFAPGQRCDAKFEAALSSQATGLESVAAP